MIRAAIAIGSNSTRMLCALVENGRMVPLIRGREETRLFMGLSEDRLLREDAVDRVVQAVARLKAQAAASSPDSIALYATSATRDAANADELRARLKAETGLDLTIISGQEEAELAYLAVGRGEDLLAIDIGGGSTELVLGQGGALSCVSLQLGASRLLMRYPVSSAEDAAALTDRIAAMPGLVSQPIIPLYLAARPPVCGIGGTMTSFRDMIAADPARFPDGALNGTNACALSRMLAPLSIDERRAVPGLPPARAQHIVHGLCILGALFRTLSIPSLRVSNAVNLDGWMWREARTERQSPAVTPTKEDS